MTTPTLESLTHSVQQVLPQSRAAWLFGSVSRGEARADSDIDVAVMFDPTTKMDAWELRQQAQVLANQWGRDVDLVNIRDVSPVLQCEIIQSNQRLFAKDVEQADNYELFAMSQYRDYNERFAPEFARIAAIGKVYG
jgi:predicted nucleotidyltransferase